MLGELLCAALFLAARPASIPSAVAWIGMALVVLAWATTAFASVPRHAVLGRGFDAHAHQVLVLTNWIRTFAWTTRGALLIWVVDRVTVAE